MNSSRTAHTTRRRPGRPTLVAVMLLFPALALLSCRPATDGRGTALVVAGSTSVQPFAEKLAEEYMALHPEENITVQGGGSTAGVRAAETGAAQIGMSSRHLKDSEAAILHPTVIAWDGIAVIVHRSNPLSGLTREQVAMIFAGNVRRWGEVGGRGHDIHFVTREEGSGTRGAFEELVMDRWIIAPRALVQDSNGAVREIVADDPDAIGYISLGLVDDRVKALSIDGTVPDRSNILAKSYSVVRPFLFLTRGGPSGRARAFIDYILGPEGQSLLDAEGLVPVGG